MNKILIVEDDPVLSSGLAVNLENCGYEIESAQTGAEAIEKLKKIKIDLILLDVNLSDGNGFEFAKIIKEEYHIPFIFLTAHNLDEEILDGFELRS